MSQATAEKAARLVAEGHVDVVTHDGDYVDALVRGSRPDPYSVMRLNGTWTCTCPARVVDCSHVRAVIAALAVS